MPKVIYPLEEEINKNLLESQNLMLNSDPSAKRIAEKYNSAIQRIKAICENRKRF